VTSLKECDDDQQHSKGELSAKELESISVRVAEIVGARITPETVAATLEKRLTAEVGRITIRAFLYACWAGALALLAWLGITNKIPPR